MYRISPVEPVDYLVVGHLTRDLTPEGPRLGGTAAYAALTAQALGLRVGVVTSWGEEVSLGPLNSVEVVNFPTDQSTTFENIMLEDRRIQYVHHVAPRLDYYMIPETWRNAQVIHLGPVAQEVEPSIARSFPSALLGVTPQGWLRSWDHEKRVHPTEWPEASFVLQKSSAAVVSIEDVEGDEDRIEEMASYCQVLAVTEADRGTRLYWRGDVRRFHPISQTEVDATGAGDIFAAAFFVRLYTTRDPWEAARFATLLSSFSVTRVGLEAIPTMQEIQECMVEVF